MLNKRFVIINLIIFNFIYNVNIKAETFTPSMCTPSDLFDNMSNNVDQRIQGLSGSLDNKRLFDTRGDMTSSWEYNNDVWVNKGGLGDIDFTGVSPWNSRGGYTRAGTLITPQHAVLSEHYSLEIGDTMLFVAKDNTVVTRTVVDKRTVFNTIKTDVDIVKLNSPVPNTIKYYPILSKEDWEKYLGNGFNYDEYTLPAIFFDQEDKLIIRNIAKNSLFKTVTGVYNYIFHNSTSTFPNRLLFDESMIGGDSGNPAFVIAGNQPVLISVNTGSVNGTSLSHYKDKIQDIINTMGGEYNTSDVDMNCFESHIVLDDVIFNYNEQAVLGNSIGFVPIKHNIDNSPVSFSITSGNSDNSFAINQNTGELTLATSTTSNISSFSFITVSAIKNNTTNISEKVYTVKKNSFPYFLNNNEVFSISENSLNEFAVGKISASDSNSDILDYSIVSGNTEGVFYIATSTGDLKIKNNNLLNFESKSTYELTVRIQERSTVDKLYSEKNFYINIEDVNYDFTQNEYVFSIDEALSTSTFVGNIFADIEDIDDISSKEYSIIGGNDNGYFNINSDGDIYINNHSDFEYLEGGQIHNLVIGVNPIGSNIVYKSVSVKILITQNTRPYVTIDKNSNNTNVYTAREGDTVILKLKLSSSYNKKISGTLYVNTTDPLSKASYLDYTFNKEFVFNPGQTEVDISVKINTDTISDNLEFFSISDLQSVKRISKNNFEPVYFLIIDELNNSASGGGGGGGGSIHTAPNTTPTKTVLSSNIKNTDIVDNSNIISNDKKINYLFTKDLKMGIVDDDVKKLQIFLNNNGFTVTKTGKGSMGKEITYFGSATKSALTLFQKKNNIKPSSGFLGPVTRNFIKTFQSK